MIFALPVMLVIVSILINIITYYPVRKKDDIIIIGYPIFCKKYNLQNNTLELQVERFQAMRGHSYNVVICVYQGENKTLIGKHILPGYMRRKRAEKELKKVKRIISS